MNTWAASLEDCDSLMERESIGYIKNQDEGGNDRGIIFVLRENGDEKLVPENLQNENMRIQN